MRLDQIKELQCEITSYCNARCPHCPRFTSDGELIPSLSLNHWDLSIIDNLDLYSMSNLKLVSIQGDKGDPVMHPRTFEIIEKFLDAPSQPMIELNTNGSIQTAEWWEKIASFGDRLVVLFSIDGLEDTNEIYRVNTKFNKIMENARAFINAGGRAYWKCLVFKHNQHQIEEVKQKAETLGFERVWFIVPFIERFLGNYSWPVYNKNKLLGNLEPTDYTQEELEKHYGFFIDKKEPPSPNVLYDNLCPNLSTGNLYITYKHHVVPCCMMHNALYEERKPFEDLDSVDLSKHKLKEILKNKFFSEDLERSLSTGCRMHFICKKSCGSQIEENLARRAQL